MELKQGILPAIFSRFRRGRPPGISFPILKFGLGFGLIFLAASSIFYFTYTSKLDAVADFFIEWRASQVALQGGNPYSEDTTRSIQLGSKGRLAAPGEDQLVFVYPYWRVFYSFPVAFLPYSQATAIWLGFLLAAYLGSLFLLARVQELKLSSALKTVAFYAGLILMFPAFSSLMLGQSALLAAAFLNLAYFGLRTGRLAEAGIFLALATVKPQLCLVIGPWLFLRALWRRDWRFIGGFLATLGLLTALSFAFYPAWFSQFVEVALRYSSYKKSLTGPGFLFEGWGNAGTIFAIVLWVVLLGGGIYGWVRELIFKEPQPGIVFDLAFCTALILTLLLPPQTNISNPAILALPIILLFARWKKGPLFWILAGVIIFGSWLLYFLLYNNFYGFLIAAWPLVMGFLLGWVYRKEIQDLFGKGARNLEA